MELISFEGWQNCIRLFNKEIELIATTDIGPRILRFGLIEGQNLLTVFPNDKGKTGGDKFRYYGGHRLWHSPEVSPRTYAPDNDPVKYEWNGRTLKLIQEIEKTTGILKEIEITFSVEAKYAGDLRIHSIHLMHRLINRNLWDIELAPWAITAFAPGGIAILPQEPYIDPADCMLPSRPVVLWHYTQMDDPHWKWGKKYIRFIQDDSLSSEQKIGILNKQGWCAYYLKGELFIKKFGFDSSAIYPDYGCNNELWGDASFVELETLGPFSKIPAGGMMEHTEDWFLTKTEIAHSEAAFEECLYPILDCLKG